MIGPEARLFDYRWSSYPSYVRRGARPEWLKVTTVLGELGLKDDGAGRLAYAQGMRDRAFAAALPEATQAREELRRQWCLGGESFRERMLRLVDGVREKLGKGRETDAPVRRSHGEDEARRLLLRGLEWPGLEAESLAGLRKGDGRKLALAAVIRAQTAVPNAWIARELHLGHVSRVSRCWQEVQQNGNLAAELRAALGK